MQREIGNMLDVQDFAHIPADADAVDQLVLACRFYDRDCAGYLDADHLEDLTHMVSCDLSSECQLSHPATRNVSPCSVIWSSHWP